MKNFTSGLKVGDPIIISGGGKPSCLAVVAEKTGTHLVAETGMRHATYSVRMKFSRQTLRSVEVDARSRSRLAIREATKEEIQRLHDERDIQSARFLVNSLITGDQARAIIKMLKGDQQ